MRFINQTTAALVATMLLAATPAAANLSDDEIEDIFLLSKEVCPGAFSPNVGNAGEYLLKVTTDEGLNESQSLLLLDFCLSYGEGLLRGVNEG